MNQNEKAALREILAQRESMYRLLARLYKTEADKDLLDGLGAAGFPEEDGGLGEGFRLIADWLRYPKSEDPVTELAVDYAHTFLGAGIADGLVSYPFESVYTSPGRLVMQDAWEDVCRIYREHGLERGEQADRSALNASSWRFLRAGLLRLLRRTTNRRLRRRLPISTHSSRSISSTGCLASRPT